MVVVGRSMVRMVEPRTESASTDEGEEERFDALFQEVEPQLRRALIARYGVERGREATAEALAWAWQHRSELLVWGPTSEGLTAG
jgi:DNA-directed RNA polymerase specialized sigma24 family protein